MATKRKYRKTPSAEPQGLVVLTFCQLEHLLSIRRGGACRLALVTLVKVAKRRALLVTCTPC